MTTPRTALTSDDIPPGPLSEDDLRRGWNQQADEHNQWESLDSAKQLAWAQALAIKADRHAIALKAESEGEGDGPPVSCRKFRQYVEGGRAIDEAVADTIRLLLLKMHDAGAILLHRSGEVEPPKSPDTLAILAAIKDCPTLEAVAQAFRALALLKSPEPLTPDRLFRIADELDP